MNHDNIATQHQQTPSRHTTSPRRNKLVMSIGAFGLSAVALLGVTACSSNSATNSPAASVSATVEAASMETHINWINNLQSDLTFTVTDTSNYDWDGGSRPDHAYPEGINGFTLKAGDSFDERLEVNSNAATQTRHPRFTVKATDSKGNVVFTKEIRFYGYIPGPGPIAATNSASATASESNSDVDGASSSSWHVDGQNEQGVVTFDYTTATGAKKTGKLTVTNPSRYNTTFTMTNA